MLHALAPRHLADVDQPLDAASSSEKNAQLGRLTTFRRRARRPGIRSMTFATEIPCEVDCGPSETARSTGVVES